MTMVMSRMMMMRVRERRKGAGREVREEGDGGDGS